MEKIEKAREEIERHKEESKGSTSQLDVQLNFSDENNEKVKSLYFNEFL